MAVCGNSIVTSIRNDDARDVVISFFCAPRLYLQGGRQKKTTAVMSFHMLASCLRTGEDPYSFHLFL